MRRLHFRRGTDLADQPAEASPRDAMVLVIDAALTFATSRKLFTQEQVASLFDMLRLAAPLPDEPGRTHDAAVDGAAACLVDRLLVSSTELVDTLLDLRLTVQAMVSDEPGTWSPQSAPNPLLHV